MCSLTIECVLLQENVFSYNRMCSLTQPDAMQEYLANLKYLQHLRETSACEKALEARILKSPLYMLLRSTFVM